MVFRGDKLFMRKFIAGLIALGISASALAQNVKISELPSAGVLTGSEIGPWVQSGATVKVTANQVQTFSHIGTQPLDSDLTAIAALTTTTTGRDLLTSADAAAIRAKAGAAVLGANGDITSLTGLTTPLTIAQGGIGAATLPTGALKGAGTGAITQASAADLSNGTTGSGAVCLATNCALAAETFSTSASVTAGTNAQGQGTLTSDYNVITTAAANPSGVTLPTGTAGRRIVIVNKGANAIAVFPATGGTVDALSANTSISVPVAGVMIFNASSTTQWYSTNNLTFSSGEAVTSFSAGSTGLTPSTATTGAVTLSGTLGTANGGTGTASVAANLLFGGPGTGAATAPSFRALVADDLPTFGTSAAGAVPASGGGTTNFLRADGTWNPFAQVYPGAGIANSTGSAWGTSYTTTGTGTVLVLGTSPALTTPTLSTNATVTAGTNAQGQGALTQDINIVTTTAASPSGNTLPTATAGLVVRVINAGTNSINLYPASGAAIDGLGSNNPQQIAVGSALELRAASSTQWYSNLHTATSQVAVLASGTTYTTPTGAKREDVYCIGGGGGGGSGARQATTSARFGGGAGAGAVSTTTASGGNGNGVPSSAAGGTSGGNGTDGSSNATVSGDTNVSGLGGGGGGGGYITASATGTGGAGGLYGAGGGGGAASDNGNASGAGGAGAGGMVVFVTSF